jgi:hypothetical protein
MNDPQPEGSDGKLHRTTRILGHARRRGCRVAARGKGAAAREIPRIGIIDDAPMWNPFREGLRGLGYLEGQNIAFEYRTADGVPSGSRGRGGSVLA